MARNIYGLDLGTYEIKVYDNKQDLIWKEKSVIAIEDGKRIFAVGDEAYEMYEKAPGNIQVVFPMQQGVISRFDDMQYLLQALLKKDRKIPRGSQYVIAVPTDVTEVEKRAFFDLLVHSNAKVREVNIIERAIAQCVGLGLDVERSGGVMVADFGGDTTELSVVSEGGIVVNKLVKIGGNTFDNAVAALVRKSYDFLIGRITSEMLRRRFGVFGGDSRATLIVAGRNLVTGVPKQQEIPISLVRAAMKEPLAECVSHINSMLERTPPEVLRAIQENGIFLTGGLSYLPGLARYLEGATGYSVHAAKRPDVCAVEGIRRIVRSKNLKKFTYSMLDENYRWMR
ncbi:MAG: rod shape-determining protein [Coprococcus sp.]|nr:rod shape-determining protein [Coprococcus sp.]